jgi:cell division transport system permease protein
VSTKQIRSFRASIVKEEFTKRIRYTSKEQAAKQFSKEIGEDFLAFLGENPLKNEIDIFLNAAYITPEKLQEIETKFLKNAFVADVSYDKTLVNLLTNNIERISFWLLILSGFFGLVAIILINSSIRLSIYSKRFNIKTMQMVGATKSFIRRPFIWQGVKLGLIGAFLALIGLAVVIYYLDSFAPSLGLLKDYVTIGYLVSGVLSAAFIITWLSTFFATQRFLNLQTDELYY